MQTSSAIQYPRTALSRTASPISASARRCLDVEQICALFPASAGAESPLSADDRQAMGDAIVDVVILGEGHPSACALPLADQLHLMVEGWAYRAESLPDGSRQIADIVLPGDLIAGTPEYPRAAQEIVACGRARLVVLQKDRIASRSAPRCIACARKRAMPKSASCGRVSSALAGATRAPAWPISWPSCTHD